MITPHPMPIDPPSYPYTPSITCPICWRTSYNAGDIHNGYCGACHAFTRPPEMFGEPMRDLGAELLGTGFWRFCSPMGIEGLMKWCSETDSLTLLAVFARTPGGGQFRAFVQEAKTVSMSIIVLKIWNRGLKGTLSRYGFRGCVETMPDGERIPGMRWNKLWAAVPQMSP